MASREGGVGDAAQDVRGRGLAAGVDRIHDLAFAFAEMGGVGHGLWPGGRLRAAGSFNW